MKVLVAGGTGFLGRAIVSQLLADGHDVGVLSRSQHPSNPLDAGIGWEQGDVVEPKTLDGKLDGYDAVVDAVQFPNSPIENPKKGFTFERIDLGGTKNLVDAARSQGVAHFIGLSGVGSAEKAPYHWQRFKWWEEEHIRNSGVVYTIFRPSWVYGPHDVSLNRFLGFARFLPFIPVIGNGKTRINPLFVGDLARHVSMALQIPEARGEVFEIGGPDVLTMDEVIRTALKTAGKRRFLLHQPKTLMKVVGAVAQHLPGRPLTPDAIDFITMDGVADTSRLTAVFGQPLTSLEGALATYLK